MHLQSTARPARGERRTQRRPERFAPAPASNRERAQREEEPRLEHRGVTREDAEQLSFELPEDRDGD